MNDVITFKSVSKVYKIGFWRRRQKALQDLSFSVPPGAIYGFLGANGAGKTTGLKILMGLQFADFGNILLWGQDAQKPENKGRVGFLPERPYFHDTMTAGEFLHFHRSLFGRYIQGKNLPTNQQLLELVGIPDVGSKRLRDFSKGMLQRLGIAQALVNDPELVILDEPMSGLDPVGRRDIRTLIKDLSDKGKTIFFSTHILSDVESLCDRIAFLERGVLKYEGGVEALLKISTQEQEIFFKDVVRPQENTLLRKSQAVGGGYRLLATNPSEAKQVIETVWLQGGQIVSVQTPSISLEQALFGKEVKE